MLLVSCHTGMYTACMRNRVEALQNVDKRFRYSVANYDPDSVSRYICVSMYECIYHVGIYALMQSIVRIRWVC